MVVVVVVAVVAMVMVAVVMVTEDVISSIRVLFQKIVQNLTMNSFVQLENQMKRIYHLLDNGYDVMILTQLFQTVQVRLSWFEPVKDAWTEYRRQVR